MAFNGNGFRNRCLLTGADAEEDTMISMHNTKKYLAGVGVAAIASLTIAAAPTHAQPAYDPEYGNGYAGDSNYSDRNDVPSVTVYAPRHYERDGATGAEINVVRASRIVDTHDLDLSTRWGMRTLNVRVDRAAREACGDIDAHYPDTMEDNSTCVSSAIHNAMTEVQDISYTY
jgi:UrcA family protein